MAARKTTKAKRKTVMRPAARKKPAARRKPAPRNASKTGAASKRNTLSPRAKHAPSNGKSVNTGNGASGSPKGLRVRMYRVGFGDFFLVSVPTPAGAKHILIDCGVHAKDAHSIEAAVDHMAQDTGKELALIIVTHRHADHVSGFSKCKDAFKQFKVERIWMSWYEDPKDEQALALQANIASVVVRLQQSLAARKDQYLDMVENIIDAMAARGGTQNPGAFEVLRGFPGNPPIDYYKAGDKPVLPPDLAEAGLDAQNSGSADRQDADRQDF